MAACHPKPGGARDGGDAVRRNRAYLSRVCGRSLAKAGFKLLAARMQSELLAIWEKTRKTVIFVTHDVHEAVYLAERVAVMSARPGRIKTIVDTRFDKDDPEVRRTNVFVDK